MTELEVTKRDYRLEPLPARIVEIVLSFREFTKLEASGGILIFAATILALLWANSPWSDTYIHLWEQHVVVGIDGIFTINESLEHWINDGLMAVFFFVVGLEIKREIVVGELSSPKKLLFPVFAALGGMLVPAAIYMYFTAGSEAFRGWGIPMATDIAFALGALALLGKRVPAGLKVFLTTFAIADDLGAILVIAIFYTENLMFSWLAVGLVGVGIALILNRLRIYQAVLYVAIGVLVWVSFLESGIHPTIAGVLMAFTIPSRIYLDRSQFLQDSYALLDEMSQYLDDDDTYRSGISTLESIAEHAQSPLQRLEHMLHPWVAFFILPVFALANAGVVLPGDITATLLEPLTIAIVAGLLIGKQIGITSAAWLSVRLKLASLPKGVGWRHVYGISWLAGIGFTVSLFIAGLAFGSSEALVNAKLGILVGSALSGTGGLVVLWLASAMKTTEEAEVIAG